MTTELREQIAIAGDGTALEGMTVLEDGGGIAASYAGKLLADLGADVIKLEPPGGDSVRRKPPFAADVPGRERSGLHLFLNTNKRSLTLDVESAAGRRLYRQIAKHCGTVITSRPIAEQRRLGLTWDDLSADAPELNQVSITVFGIDTQREGWQSESLIASLASGISYRIGDPDKAPLGLPYDAPQYQGGIHAAIAALLARRATREDGVGQHAWLSIVDIISNVMAGAGRRGVCLHRAVSRSGRDAHECVLPVAGNAGQRRLLRSDHDGRPSVEPVHGAPGRPRVAAR